MTGQTVAIVPTIGIPPAILEPLIRAVADAGARLSEPEEAEVLVWLTSDAKGLRQVLERSRQLRWIQLPSAGVEWAALFDRRYTWVCAKGVFAPLVAEHGLALMLAATRLIHTHARRRRWHRDQGHTLYGSRVLFLGGGGISAALLKLLEPFKVQATVVRKHAELGMGAGRTVGPEALNDAVVDADWLVVALALTPETEGIVDVDLLSRMTTSTWVVNLARGRHVVTNDLVAALRADTIGGAALDVTDPEPLPEDHPLWGFQNVIITPHVASYPWEVAAGHLATRLKENLRRDLAREPLLGVIDPDLGY